MKATFVQDRILKLNGYYQISDDLRDKFSRYISSSGRNKISSFFSWSDFEILFSSMTFNYTISYYNRDYILGYQKKGRKHLWFFSEDKSMDYGYESEVFNSPQLLLKSVRIDGKALNEIWYEIEID